MIASSVSTTKTWVCITPLLTLKSAARQLSCTCLSPNSLVTMMLPTFRPISSSSILLIVPSLTSALTSPFDEPSRAATEVPVADSWASPLIWPTVACIFSMVGNSCLIWIWRALTLAVAAMVLPLAPLPSRRMVERSVPPATPKSSGRERDDAILHDQVGRELVDRQRLVADDLVGRIAHVGVDRLPAFGAEFLDRQHLAARLHGIDAARLLAGVRVAADQGRRGRRTRSCASRTLPDSLPRGLPPSYTSLPPMSLEPTLPLKLS